MDNKMIEVKDNFWNKLKRFFQNIILRNKNNLTNSEIRSFDEIEEAYNNNEKIDEEKIEKIQKTIDEKQSIIKENEEKEENQGKYKKTIVNGKEIRCSEKDDGQTYTKRYICVGEKEASYTNATGYQTKIFTLYGYRNSYSNVRGLSFNEKVRDKKLDKQIQKTTKQGTIEETSRGPLLDSDNEQYMGRYERKEIKYENGNRTIEDNKEVIDENGNTQSINETHTHNGNSYTHTKYLNGQVVFQLVRDEKGTTIKEYDNQGNVKEAYTYDKDGKPTETLNMIGQDGKVRKIAKTYKGINHIPKEKVDVSNGVVNMDKEYMEYAKALERAGLPQHLADILDNTYEEHIPQFELKEFDMAKEQLSKQEQTQIHARENQEQMER